MPRQLFNISTDNQRNRRRLNGAQVAVMGAARSGLALAKLLASAGAKVLLSERRPEPSLEQSLEPLKSLGVTLELGGHSQRMLAAELICISPGIPLTNPILQDARRTGIPIVGELEVASWFCDVPIIAITGSNGKTTTTRLSWEILSRKYRKVILGGNIGVPLAAAVQQNQPVELAVLEVSSFQLETIVNFRPRVAVLMNFSPNHLDRYPDYEAYIEAKLRILDNLRESDFLLYNADDPLLSGRISAAISQKVPFSNSRELKTGAFWKDQRIEINWQQYHASIAVERNGLRGPHNRHNMVVAALLGVIYQVEETLISEVLRSFTALEHRLEPLQSINGVHFFNDSKATTVAALGYALQSFTEPIILIAGGIPKGGDFSKLIPLLKRRVRAAVVMGEAAAAMKRAWNGSVAVYEAADLETAVHQSLTVARQGDVVLLSPACSSFDMFQDYEDRGRRFKEIVQCLNIAHEHSAG